MKIWRLDEKCWDQKLKNTTWTSFLSFNNTIYIKMCENMNFDQFANNLCMIDFSSDTINIQPITEKKHGDLELTIPYTTLDSPTSYNWGTSVEKLCQMCKRLAELTHLTILRVWLRNELIPYIGYLIDLMKTSLNLRYVIIFQGTGNPSSTLFVPFLEAVLDCTQINYLNVEDDLYTENMSGTLEVLAKCTRPIKFCINNMRIRLGMDPISFSEIFETTSYVYAYIMKCDGWVITVIVKGDIS